MSSIPKLWLTSSIVTIGCLFPHLTLAQVIPDGTTPSTLDGYCSVRCDIIGGIKADSNLFHSFQEFNIGTGESLYFVDPGVANIFSRVTGNDSSHIFGKLGVTGNANLWLLNPQGIIFGNGATLDVSGSFVATTADAIAFGDRLFSATPDASENLPLLTVNPSAFFYHQMGQHNPITLEGASLTVPVSKSLVLLGAQNEAASPGVTIKGSAINAPQGNIQIGAVAAESEIPIDSNLQLQFTENAIAGNVTITQGSQIDVSGVGGGSIDLYGGELNIVDSQILSGTLGNIDGLEMKIFAEKLNIERSLIAAFSNGMGNGGNIEIDANSIEITRNKVDTLQQLLEQTFSNTLSPGDNNILGITTSASSLGAAGTIEIESNNLSIANGSLIASVVYSQGRGGDIEISATDNIELNSSALTAFSDLNGTGEVGNINLKTEQLIVRDGSIVSTAIFGSGAGGNITIDATESVNLLRTPPNSLIPTAIFANSIFLNAGDAGNLNISTKNLIILDGGQISSASGLLTNEGIIPFGGAGGDITIDATESVTISGSSANGIFPSSIVSDTRSNSPAGNIKINTGAFLLNGQASVSASSIGTGDGGNLTIDATESIELNGVGKQSLLNLIQNSFSPENLSITDIRGGLFAVSFIGNTQNINLKTPNLSLNNGSLVSTASFGTGNAGDIKINTSETVEIIQSIISSTSFGTGNAGDIAIDTHNLQIRNAGSIITSNIGVGKAGNLTINATELVELSEDENYTDNLSLQGGIVTSNLGEGTTGAGNLLIKTKNLIVRDGLEIDISNERIPPIEGVTSTLAEVELPESTKFTPNNSVIQATESVTISGSSADRMFTSSIRSSTETNLPANNIQIVTPQLTISDGADISVSSSGTGAAGSLEVVADKMTLQSGGTLNADTFSSQGGNINLKIADTLLMSDRATMTTNALNQSNGGNITIDTNFLIALPTSSITATAISGQGGNIDIEAREIFVASPSQISASSQLGIDGEVTISTFTNDLRNNITKLPEKTLKTTERIISHCGVEDEFDRSSFVYIGRGALPPNPLERFSRDEFLVDWGTDFDEFEFHSFKPSPKPAIVEANRWIVSDRGEIVLIAEATSNNFLPHYRATCPFE